MAGIRMQQGLRQEMQLLPRMLQSIEVLQLAVGELRPFLEEAALENEALLLDAAAEATSSEAQQAEGPEPWGSVGEGSRGSGSASSEASDRHSAWLESLSEEPQGLTSFLEEQLGLSDIESELMPWVKLVIQALDPSGMLSISDDALLEIARESGLEPDNASLGRAIAQVQGMEPRGVGGRDLVETLLLQLDPRDVDYALLARLLEECLEDVATNKLPLVARALGIDLATLSGLLTRLKEIDPAPGSAFSGATSPPIAPDILVEPVEEELASGQATRFEVRILNSGLPSVAIDENLRLLARDPDQEPGVRRYLRSKLEAAGWLLDAVEQRERTLLRVATWIFERQVQFLREGQERIVPLTMTEAAQDLELHLSTVSRAVSGKYAETPHGLVPLRSLFPVSAGGRPELARGSVQQALTALVKQEDPARPLSDEELVLGLEKSGFRVARRTVAKHRRELGIPSSYRRRRYGSPD